MSNEPEYLMVSGEPVTLAATPSRLVIMADDGRDLLTVTVTADGLLDVSGPEDAWTEGAARFVAEVRRMLGAG
jgi:hypothetical protein